MPNYNNNGGANAIKGFNYQKSVIVLIAVLHYLDDNDFLIHVETEDDIVVTIDNIKTYIQVKGKPLGIGPITQRPEGKDSIIEKNLATSDEADSFYKIISPSFTSAKKHLIEAKAAVMTDGAEVYTYSETAIAAIKEKLTNLSELKLNNSKVAITSFKSNYKAALDHIIGIMSRKGIPVDNSHGMASLQELCLQIDQRSEKQIQSSEDYDKKMFTKDSLKTIFRHSHKVKHYEDIVIALNYPLFRQIELKRKNATVGAIYSSYVEIARQSIIKMDLMNMDEKTIISQTMEEIAFNAGVDELDKEAVVINAYSQVLFEKSQA